MKKVSKNSKETTQIAKIFLNKILQDKNSKKDATIVCLSGDLGSGKTAFTQAVGKHLGVKRQIVSPTFVIIKKYPLKKIKYQFLFHIDAYRLKNAKELLHLGWEEIISNKNHLIFIEWPENVSKVIPADARFVYISHTKSGYRNLELK